MKYIYKNSSGYYYCGNGVISNDINTAETYSNNLYFFVGGLFKMVSYEKELRKQKIKKINSL